MSMIRYRHTVKSGEVRVYEYEPRPYQAAISSCRHTLSRVGRLVRIGGRWRSSRQGRSYQNATVQQLIRLGEAIRDGDVVRAAIGAGA